MPERLIKTITLNNSLTLEIWDLSQVLAGDRWLVNVEARMEVPFLMAQPESLPDFEDIFVSLKKVYGENIPYRYSQKRHFLDKKEKEEVFQTFLDTLQQDLVPYLSHPDFARKLLLYKYRELKTRQPHLFI